MDYSRGVDLELVEEPPARRCRSSPGTTRTTSSAATTTASRRASCTWPTTTSVPGKKFFEWGNGPEGRMWDKILTDDRRPLPRADGRRLLRQPARLQLDPARRDRSRQQYWYPDPRARRRQERQLRGGRQPRGRSRRHGAAGVQRDRAAVRTPRCGSTRRRQGALEEQITIGPDKPFVREVPLPAGTRARTCARRCVRGRQRADRLSASRRRGRRRRCPSRSTPPPPRRTGQDERGAVPGRPAGWSSSTAPRWSPSRTTRRRCAATPATRAPTPRSAGRHCARAATRTPSVSCRRPWRGSPATTPARATASRCTCSA